MVLKLSIKPFSFNLLRTLKTAQAVIKEREGWLIKLETKSGQLGWGEIAPFKSTEKKICEKILKAG